MPHPLDPLSKQEIQLVAQIVRQDKGQDKVWFNSISLKDPPKADMLAFLQGGKEPTRIAECVLLERVTGTVFDGDIDVKAAKVLHWKVITDAQPTIIPDDLLASEVIVRKDPEVIRLCKELGIDDMNKVMCDGWALGYDPRYGSHHRVQQGLLYLQISETDNMYAHPLPFFPIIDVEAEKVLTIDVRAVEHHVPIPMASHDYYVDKHRTDLKPIEITQPQGPSFKLNGNELSWLNWKMHVGFNYREGIVINNLTWADRSIMWRMSLCEMIVPYGDPDEPYVRKHAFDVSEYGLGMMTNSLSKGCDCKGDITYIDGIVNNRLGEPVVIPNAICIHEEDSGILHKHTDFRNNKAMTTRARKLIVSSIVTAANYDYGLYWTFHSDGNIEFRVLASGILSVHGLAPGEERNRYGTEVGENIIAHNHQHLFNLRLDPMIDGPNNSVVQIDSLPSEIPLGSPGNVYGNAFYARRTTYKTAHEAQSDYDAETSRTWNIENPNKLHSISKKPIGYKIVNRDAPRLLAKENSIVWKRAAFARHALWVTPFKDEQLYAAGEFVTQSSGDPSFGIPEYIKEDKPVENTDLVVWLTFGLTVRSQYLV